MGRRNDTPEAERAAAPGPVRPEVGGARAATSGVQVVALEANLSAHRGVGERPRAAEGERPVDEANRDVARA